MSAVRQRGPIKSNWTEPLPLSGYLASVEVLSRTILCWEQIDVAQWEDWFGANCWVGGRREGGRTGNDFWSRHCRWKEDLLHLQDLSPIYRIPLQTFQPDICPITNMMNLIYPSNTILQQWPRLNSGFWGWMASTLEWPQIARHQYHQVTIF